MLTVMKPSLQRFTSTKGYLFFSLTLTLLISACAEVPVTHRKGLRLLPESQLLVMSFQEYRQVLQKSKLSTDQDKVRMVRSVGDRIAKSAEAFLEESGRGKQVKNYHWEFNLIEDDKMVNAWCMPGGKVAVYTGILPYTQNEAGLAVVMGHEVAHALAGHGNERIPDTHSLRGVGKREWIRNRLRPTG